MIRINYQSDFAVRVTLKDVTGTAIEPPTEYPWWLHFTDSAGTCWKCGYNGTTYEDCSIEDGAVICYVNNPGYVPGALAVTYMDDVPDAHYADGHEKHVLPIDGALYLWQGASDYSGTVDIEAVIQLIAPQITGASVDTAGDLNLVINYTIPESNGNDN